MIKNLNPQKVQLGVTPTLWWNDDFPSIDIGITFGQCVSEMALAGFTRSEIEIVAERDTLHVAGRKQKDDTQRTYLHRGIAQRDFEQRFQLANHVKVVSAGFDNGILTIELVREVPEALKPRKIAIADANGNTDNVQVLEQPQQQAA